MREAAMIMVVRVGVFVRMIMHVEFHTADAHLLPTGDVRVPAFELQLPQLPLQLPGVHAQINERTDKHVAADAAENVEVKRFHFCSCVRKNAAIPVTLSQPLSHERSYRAR